MGPALEKTINFAPNAGTFNTQPDFRLY